VMYDDIMLNKEWIRDDRLIYRLIRDVCIHTLYLDYPRILAAAFRCSHT
jgi:hypothetical protein